MAKKQDQKPSSSSSSVTSIEDKPIKKTTNRTRKSVSRDSPQQRTSVFRGVTRHRLTGRYEAHLWDKICWNETQKKKGKQVYLGAYDDEEAAAHAYDLAALKYWGQDTILNFPLNTYQKELKDMEGQSKEEYIGSLRRKSSGFSRGVSKYRGVARHHHNGRWEARIGRVFGNKYLYLGTYATQEEAATAYDMAAIESRGLNAVTNFDIRRYIICLRPNQTNNTDYSTQQETSTDYIEVDSMLNLNQEVGSKNLLHQPQSSSSIESSSVPPPSAGGAHTLGLLQSTKLGTSAVDSPTTTQETSAPRRSFPDDIQTYFDCQDSSNFTDAHDDIFGEFASAMFPCDL